MIKISKYQFVVVLTWILTVIGIYKLIQNEDFIWLIATWSMARFNHLCTSLHHRMISHRSFVAGSTFKNNLIILLSVFQVHDSPLKFAIAHRHHHKYSDQGKNIDVHGPVTGFFNTLIGWELTLESKQRILQMKIYKDLLRDKFLVWFDNRYYFILILTFLSVYLISSNLFWYVVIPASVMWKLEANFFVNWYCHLYGYRNYNLEKDTSSNSLLAGYITMGEGWHNNHHADPGNYNFKRNWWEFDVTGFLIKNYFIK